MTIALVGCVHGTVTIGGGRVPSRNVNNLRFYGWSFTFYALPSQHKRRHQHVLDHFAGDPLSSVVGVEAAEPPLDGAVPPRGRHCRRVTASDHVLQQYRVTRVVAE